MASAFETRFQEVAAPRLMEEHGEIVTRYPKGYDGSPQSVTAIWEPDETPERLASMEVEQATRSGTLLVASDVETHTEDKWLIGSDLYATVTKGDVIGDSRRLTLTRTDKVSTSRQRGRL